MLETLRIQNYALIDSLELEFGPGFNALTGETGAGKSIIVGALDLVLGGRASNEALRDPAKQARIDATFRLTRNSRRLTKLLAEHDIALDDEVLILARVLTPEGRSRAYLSGTPVPVSLLSEVGNELVDLHGQHEHQSLLRPDRQLDLLDVFADLEQDVEDVAGLVGTLRTLSKEVAAMESDDRERARRIEFLRHELQEIDAAELERGEEEALRARRNLITNAERIFSLASQARTALYEAEEGSAIGSIDLAIHNLTDLAAIDDRFRAIEERLTSARVTVEEASSDLRQLADGLEYDPDELDKLNQRLSLIGTLKRKYGSSIGAILDYRAQSAAEIEAFDDRDQRLAQARERQKALAEQVKAKAAQLSQKRRAAARKLDKLVTAALQDLGMKGGHFESAFTDIDITLSGIDALEFMLAANPGEKLKPLRSVASGGEVSRIMLALKAVFAKADRIPTLIFDEIDAGVGGHIARNVARKIQELADSHQVLCITHLAQIAAVAQDHYVVLKQTQKTRTQTSVARLGTKERVEEIARLLDGSISDVSVKHAAALLKEMTHNNT